MNNDQLKRRHLIPDTSYEDLMALCDEVELSLQHAVDRRRASTRHRGRRRARSQGPPMRQSLDDDMFRRRLVNATTAAEQELLPSNWDQPPESSPLLANLNARNHYAFASPDPDKYRSRFLPMRKPDLIKDDAAFRKHVR